MFVISKSPKIIKEQRCSTCVDEQYVLVFYLLFFYIVHHAGICFGRVCGIHRDSVVTEHILYGGFYSFILFAVAISDVIINENSCGFYQFIGYITSQIFFHAVKHPLPTSWILSGNADTHDFSLVSMHNLTAHKTRLCSACP